MQLKPHMQKAFFFFCIRVRVHRLHKLLQGIALACIFFPGPVCNWLQLPNLRTCGCALTLRLIVGVGIAHCHLTILNTAVQLSTLSLQTSEIQAFLSQTLKQISKKTRLTAGHRSLFKMILGDLSCCCTPKALSQKPGLSCVLT